MYKTIKVIVRPIFNFLFGTRFIGKENLEGLTGGYIVVSNHKSNFDPISVHLAITPKPYLMAKEELFHNPLFAKFIRALGAFPVTRGAGDMSAVKTAFKLLKEGKVLGMFPEGTRSKNGKIKAFHPGAAMIALRTKAKVVPIYISGNYKPFTRNRVYIGEPLDLAANAGTSPTSTESVKEATKTLRRAMLALQERAEQKR